MSGLFELKSIDSEFYNKFIRNYLPDKIIDIHTHVWKNEFMKAAGNEPVRTVSWPMLIANDNPVESLMETYKLMFPDKCVTPLIFSYVGNDIDLSRGNMYIKQCSQRHGFLSLMVSKPHMSGDEFEKASQDGGFLGCKVYLNYAEPYIPENEIRIFDFLPRHQLEVLNRHGWMVMLHIPRPGRLKDPVNLHQMMEIEKCYPDIKLVIAHVGRAYCPEDLGDAFDQLKAAKNMMFDISANANAYVFGQLIKAVGSKRILFGSDLPILRMRAKRICENGRYINLVPRGLYGDLQGDSHMREIEWTEADNITFFMYEEIFAFLQAADATGLNEQGIEDVFYNNAQKLLSSIKENQV